MSDYNDGILPEPCLRMDTHFGDEYESVEFGDGTGYIKAAPILAKVGALHEEIDRMRDENAELRELVLPLVNFADYECNLMHDCTACQMGSGDRPCCLVKALRYLHGLGVDV